MRATNSETMTRFRSKLRDYYILTKPEVNLLVVMTTGAGYYLASRGVVNFFGLLNTVTGTLLVASGTATLNQWMERIYDGQMRRTAKRPLPAGRVSAAEAFRFGALVSAAGGVYLAVEVNPIASVLAISTLLSYLLIYTPLKRKTPLCTLLGAFPGAMPTLIGWTGASSTIDSRAWFLFAILFLWQFPHFLAIALMYREDYALAGYKMLPQFDQDGRFTRGEVFAFTLMLVLLTSFAFRSSPICATLLLLAGSFLLYPAGKLLTTGSRNLASKVVHASVMYLPIVLLVTTRMKMWS